MQVSKNTDFSDITFQHDLIVLVFLDESRAIETNALGENSAGRGVVQTIVFVLIHLLTLIEHALDGHLVDGKSASLVGANLISAAHSLASIEFSHKILLFVHFGYGESKRNSHGKGKTFGNSDHNDGDSNNEGVKTGIQNLSTLIGSFRLNDIHVDEASDDHGNESSEGYNHAKKANLVSNGGQLLLEGSLFGFHRQNLFKPSRFSVSTDIANDTLADALDDHCAAEQDGVGFAVD